MRISLCILTIVVVIEGSPAQTGDETKPAGAEPVELVLSLNDALRMAVKNNLALRSALLDEQIERERIREALGAFDPTFFAGTSYGRQESLFSANFPLDPSLPNSPTVARIISETSDVANLNFGIRGVLETGLSYDLTFNTDYRFRKEGDGLNPIYSSSATLNFTQPLLRSAWESYQMAPVELARIRTLDVRESYRITEREKLVEVQQAYYDLVFALEDLKVKQQSVTLAGEQIKLTKQRVASGSLAEIEITSAESAAAQRRAELISAEAAVVAAEDRLRRIILSFERDDDWNTRIRPSEEVVDPTLGPIATPELLSLAERAHPELLRAHLEVASAGVDVRQRNSERQATLDFVGSGTLNSLADRPDNSWRQAFRRDEGAASWNVGFEFEYPIGNRAAAARAAQSEITLRKARINLADTRTEMIFGIRTAVRDLDVAHRSIAARREAERLSKEQLANERLRLELRKSTNFQVFQVEEELSQRRTELIRAILDHQLALLELSRRTGVPLPEIVKKR